MDTDEPGNLRSHRCPFWMHYLLASPLRRLVESPEKLLGPHVRPGMTVLEPGCGFGFFSLPLARMVGAAGRVVCVDVEAAAIARLRRRAEKAGLGDRIDASVCTTTDLGVGSRAGQVDLVVVIHALHEVADIPGFVAQAASALAPSGRLLIVEPKGHVSPEQFAHELDVCRRAGFRERSVKGGEGGERGKGGRLLALLERTAA